MSNLTPAELDTLQKACPTLWDTKNAFDAHGAMAAMVNRHVIDLILAEVLALVRERDEGMESSEKWVTVLKNEIETLSRKNAKYYKRIAELETTLATLAAFVAAHSTPHAGEEGK